MRIFSPKYNQSTVRFGYVDKFGEITVVNPNINIENLFNLFIIELITEKEQNHFPERKSTIFKH